MNDKVKELCREISKTIENGAHFNYVFEKNIVIGCVMNVERYGIIQGELNNIIGNESQCANLFYAQILLYAAQIKEMLGYSSEELVASLINRLVNDEEYFDDIPAVIGFRKKHIHKSGTS